MKGALDTALKRPGSRGRRDRDTTGLLHRKQGQRGRSCLELLSHHRILPPFISFCPSPKPPLCREGQGRAARGSTAQHGLAASARAGNKLPARASPLDPLLAPAATFSPRSVALGVPPAPAPPPGRMGHTADHKKGQSAPNLPSPGRAQQPQAGRAQHEVGPGSLWCFPA